MISDCNAQWRQLTMHTTRPSRRGSATRALGCNCDVADAPLDGALCASVPAVLLPQKLHQHSQSALVRVQTPRPAQHACLVEGFVPRLVRISPQFGAWWHDMHHVLECESLWPGLRERQRGASDPIIQASLDGCSAHGFLRWPGRQSLATSRKFLLVGRERFCVFLVVVVERRVHILLV